MQVKCYYKTLQHSFIVILRFCFLAFIAVHPHLRTNIFQGYTYAFYVYKSRNYTGFLYLHKKTLLVDHGNSVSHQL